MRARTTGERRSRSAARTVRFPALTYTVRCPKPGLKMNIDYVRYIVHGLREHGVEDEYIAKVKAIAAANNPDIAAEVEKL